MARRRRHRTARRSRAARRPRGKPVSFKTRRGKPVSFRTTGRGHRKTAWNKVFGKASAACRRKRGVRPFTKKFGQCMKAYLRAHR